jgi:hypothetical protein
MSCDGENTCKYTIHIFQRVVLSMPLELILYLKSKKKKCLGKDQCCTLTFYLSIFLPFLAHSNLQKANNQFCCVYVEHYALFS